MVAGGRGTPRRRVRGAAPDRAWRKSSPPSENHREDGPCHSVAGAPWVVKGCSYLDVYSVLGRKYRMPDGDAIGFLKYEDRDGVSLAFV